MAKTGYLALAATLLAACSSEAPQPTAPLSLPVVTQAVHAPGDGNGGNFGTPLSSREEVPPAGVVNTSNAQGSAIFHLSADGTQLSYKLIVSNIENVFMAHIHRGQLTVYLRLLDVPVPSIYGPTADEGWGA